MNITVGQQIFKASVCTICPRRPRFYPQAAFEAHMLRHTEDGFDHENAWFTRQKVRAKKAQAALRRARKTVQ